MPRGGGRIVQTQPWRALVLFTLLVFSQVTAQFFDIFQRTPLSSGPYQLDRLLSYYPKESSLTTELPPRRVASDVEGRDKHNALEQAKRKNKPNRYRTTDKSNVSQNVSKYNEKNNGEIIRSDKTAQSPYRISRNKGNVLHVDNDVSEWISASDEDQTPFNNNYDISDPDITDLCPSYDGSTTNYNKPLKSANRFEITRPTNNYNYDESRPLNSNYDISRPSNSNYDISRPPNSNYGVPRPSNSNYDVSRPSNSNYDISRPPNSNYDISRPSNSNYEISRPMNSNSGVSRPTDNKPEYVRPSNNNYDSLRPSVVNIDTSRPNNGRPNNDFTNPNPPYIRPGVKPVQVVTNQTPFTNKPITWPTTKNPLSDSHHSKPITSDSILFPEEEEDDSTPEIVMGHSEENMSEVEKRRYVELADRMCDRYKALSVKQVQAIPLLPSPDPVRVNVSSCKPPSIPLVVGGEVVSIRDYPHMALVGWMKVQGGYSWKCGGSLVSERFVLTAGHCTFIERDSTINSGPPSAVQLGSSYRDDPGALVRRVSTVIRHPKYHAPLSYYDLALLKLDAIVTFSEVIKPACIGVAPPAGNVVVATGWGQTESAETSQELRSVSLRVWDMEECRRVLGATKKIPQGPSRESQLCAGDRRGGHDTCQGDSGGPVQVQDGCTWKVVAVTSLGRGCAAPDTPGLYAVARKAFIASHIYDASSDNSTGNLKPSADTTRRPLVTTESSVHSNYIRYNQRTSPPNDWWGR